MIRALARVNWARLTSSGTNDVPAVTTRVSPVPLRNRIA